MELKRSPGCLIALSAGGDPKELAEKGIGIEHVEELMVQLAMKLLRDGHRLSFGGTLGDSKQPLTQQLIDAAQNWLDEDTAKHADIAKPMTWPLANYSAWPYFTFISDEQRARLVGVCRFDDIRPIGVAQSELDELKKNWKGNPEARRKTSDSLSAMRKKSANEADLRIVWGGKIAGAAGWMAGILEEVAYSLQFEKPVIVLGGLGGCAGLLGEFLADKNASWPDKLSLDASADTERDALQTEAEKQVLQDRFEKAKGDLEAYRKSLFDKPTVHGIKTDRIREGLSEESPSRIIQFAAEAAAAIVGNTGKK